MADDKKKEKPPLVDKYTLMSTDALLKIVDDWHADTEAQAKKREEIKEKEKKAVLMFQGIENDYLIEKRGADKANPKLPAKLSLDKKNARIEATELLNRMLLRAVRHELGDETAKAYEKNPHHLVDYAQGKGINFYHVRDQMIEKYKNLDDAEDYQEIKMKLAGQTIEDKLHLNRATRELGRNTGHHEKIRALANKRLQKHGYELTGNEVSIGDVLNHYIAASGKSISSDHVVKYDTHFKKYEKKAGK